MANIDILISMTSRERKDLLQSDEKVDVYARVETTGPYSLVFAAVSKNVLDTFSGSASKAIRPRMQTTPLSPANPSSTESLADEDDRTQRSLYVWLITGHTPLSVKKLLQWMITTCSKVDKLPDNGTAGIFARNLKCEELMSLFHAAHKLDIPLATRKLSIQLTDDMPDIDLEYVLTAWQCLRRLGTCGQIRRRFECKVRGLSTDGYGLSLDELSLLWTTDFPMKTKKAAAEKVGRRPFEEWDPEHDAEILEELPQECYDVIYKARREQYAKELQGRTGQFSLLEPSLLD
ncbi:MAG: hypothetical protein Q9162_004860 [Coniocarpon cinnabarinum]